MEAFQLRLWDGRLGRWLSPDPYGQYASPYLGMGNNPVGLIDADGGWAGDGDPPSGDPIPTQYLNEIVVYPMMDKYSFSDWLFRSHLQQNNDFYFKHVLRREAEGNFNRLQTVSKDHWGNFKSQFDQGGATGSKYDVFGQLLLIGTAPVAVAPLAGGGLAVAEEQALTLAARAYLKYQVATGSVTAGSGTTVLLGRYMDKVINPEARAMGYTTITNSLPAIRALTMPYNRLWLQHHLNSGSQILMHINSNSGLYSSYMQMEIQMLLNFYGK